MRSTGVFQYYALLRGKTSAALRPPCQRPSVRRRGDLHIHGGTAFSDPLVSFATSYGGTC